LREIFETMAAGVESRQESPSLSILCRTLEQMEAALDCDAKTIYADFEDIRRYKDAVGLVRREPGVEILLATPRIQKAGEQGFFKLIESAGPDGVLIRNLGAIEYFAGKSLKKTGDFSLNVANPLTAAYLLQKGLGRVTISYDLDIDQVLALLRKAPPAWFELTIHQHMPMFHMEHCVFAAFMSKGTTFLDCGRPCEKHRVHLRDRVGIEHPLRADVGCRNTLFNASAQTGANFFRDLQAAGLRNYRIELLEETADESRAIIRAYQSLLAGERDGENLWRQLNAQSQLGVTHGTYQPV
jgi:putative protease